MTYHRTVHHGSCLCGGVTFRIGEPVGAYVYCHCKSCRKSSGTGFAANIAVPEASFTLLSGTRLISDFESSAGKIRHFCSRCGTPLYTSVGATNPLRRVRLGTLDSVYQQACVGHIFVQDKASWDQIDDTAPQFQGWPDASVLAIRGSKQSSDG